MKLNNKFKWLGEITTIGWDLDGTLYRSIPQMSEEIDMAMIGEFGKHWQGNTAADVEFWRRYKKLGSRTRVLDSSGIDGKRYLMKLFNDYDYGTYLKRDERLIEMFGVLKKFRHFILTNSGLRVAMKKLHLLGIGEAVFEKVFATHETEYVKPDERAFVWALQEMGVSAEKVLMIGDRDETDIVPAKKIGMRTGFVWGKSDEADFSVDTIYDVGKVIGGLYL